MAMDKSMLVADIGGTNARFAMAGFDGDKIRIHDAVSYKVKDFATLEKAALDFLGRVKIKPARASFAIAAPIKETIMPFTNSPWVLDRDVLTKALGVCELCIVNDFHAKAAGLGFLSAKDFISIKPGKACPQAPILVLGPGTGLGQALIIPAKEGRKIITTEGGHISFAPISELEIKILRVLRQGQQRVSVEQILSGRGLENTYQALGEILGEACPPKTASEISAAARERKDGLAQKTVDIFLAILGNVVGDGVLASGARGGVVLAGGVVSGLQDMFGASHFVERFKDKGCMEDYVAAVPINLLVSEQAALLGAAFLGKQVKENSDDC
jgi:glucokinase